MIRLACLAVAICSFGGDFSNAEFAQRREKLRKSITNGAILLYGRTDKQAEEDRNGFFQEPNFFYLTGLRDPGLALLLTPEEEVLYVPKRDAKIELWNGKRLAFEDEIRKQTGIPSARPGHLLEDDLKKAAPPTIYVLPSSIDTVRKLLPESKIEDPARSISLLRMTKSQAEIAALERSISATIRAQRAAWKTIRSGLYEYQLAATVMHSYLDSGCERNAFPPIIGSGPNGTTLHYFRNNRRMDSGELVLLDVGAECGGYAGDLTRTVPVNGKFSPRQRELYDAVLAAERAVIAAAKPGVTVKDLKQVAIDALNADNRDLGKYLPHGVSHHVGLEVHDAADNDVPLSSGAVITVEPGVYIPDERIGIRIEDMVLITEKGARLLSGNLPVEAADIEREMSRPAK